MVAVAAACLSLAATASSASAQSSTSATAITSSRSFPKTTTVKKNLLAESTSTSVDSNSNWGGIESLNPPQTKSTAEKEAEAKAAAEKAAAEAAAQAAAQAVAQAAAQAQQQAASRSQSRSSLSASTSSPSATVTVNPPDSASASALVAYAAQFVGVVPYVYGGNTPAGWDCSGFVQYVFAQMGISLPHSSGAQAAVGTAVPSLAEAQPGDIIANGAHSGIYVGNGMVVNALNKNAGTVYTPVAYAFSGSYSIRRLL